MIREAVGFYLSVGGHDFDPLRQIYLVTCLNPHTVTSSENNLRAGEMWMKKCRCPTELQSTTTTSVSHEYV